MSHSVLGVSHHESGAAELRPGKLKFMTPTAALRCGLRPHPMAGHRCKVSSVPRFPQFGVLSGNSHPPTLTSSVL